jgi:hypothetical protein
VTHPLSAASPTGGVESFLVAVATIVGLPIAIFLVGHLFDTYVMAPWDGTDPEAGIEGHTPEADAGGAEGEDD